jgi:carbon-monoxide dehydrogenase large subunit
LHVAFVRSSLRAREDHRHRHSGSALLLRVSSLSTPEKDVAEKIGPVPCAGALPGLKVPDHRVLATTRFTSSVIRSPPSWPRDRYAARDAVDLVMVDYEDLPVVTDVEAAAAGGPVIHEAFGDNIAYRLTSGEGDIDAAFAAADRTVKQRILHNDSRPLRWSRAACWLVTSPAKKS